MTWPVNLDFNMKVANNWPSNGLIHTYYLTWKTLFLGEASIFLLPHVPHILPILWAKVPKKNLKENEVILSVDFSKNYQNKQRHEIQSAYFGHEDFTLFTAACYFHRAADIESFSSNIDHDSCLVIVPAAVVSNETSHDRNVAFTNNNKLISFLQEINPAVDTFHFWSDGCARQFRSEYVFRSFSYYPANIKLTWNYGEAHHFKGMLNCDEIVYYIEEVSA